MLLDTSSKFVAVYILLTDPTIFSGKLNFSSKIMTIKKFERNHQDSLKPISPSPREGEFRCGYLKDFSDS